MAEEQNIRPVVTALASYGLSGRVFHAPYLDAHPGFDLRVIMERSKNLSAERYPKAHIVRSFDELLATPGLELVVVNTPDDTHYEYARRAMEAGKNVVVEKPLVFTYAEAEELIGLARDKGVLLTTYQNRRYDGDFMTLRRIIEGGSLGRIVEFRNSMQRFRPQVAAGSWKEKAVGNIGTVYNLGPHLVDQALQLFGMPDRLWARLDRQRDGAAVDDYMNVTMIYDRLTVTLRAGYLIREEEARFAVHGTDGSFVKFGTDPQEERLKAGAMLESGDIGREDPAFYGVLNDGAGRRTCPTIDGDYRLYYDNIYDVLRRGADAAVSHGDMLDVIRVLEAILESNRSGACVGLK